MEAPSASLEDEDSLYFTYNEVTNTYNPFYTTNDGQSYYESLPSLESYEPEQYYYNPSTNEYQTYNDMFADTYSTYTIELSEAVGSESTITETFTKTIYVDLNQQEGGSFFTGGVTYGLNGETMPTEHYDLGDFEEFVENGGMNEWTNTQPFNPEIGGGANGLEFTVDYSIPYTVTVEQGNSYVEGSDGHVQPPKCFA